ncbi:hypothetical protein BDR05DRAFT_956562 [Suillus weaverae]|nr:hypothetical protein BDR05DRAFT_956562 [Suillus weaverae]
MSVASTWNKITRLAWSLPLKVLTAVHCALCLVFWVRWDAGDPHCAPQLLRWKTCQEHIYIPFGAQMLRFGLSRLEQDVLRLKT